jgi:hypothetical protein
MKKPKRLLGGSVHYYNGRLNGRGSRQLSKIRKGMKKEDMTLIFKKIEDETKERKK